MFRGCSNLDFAANFLRMESIMGLDLPQLDMLSFIISFFGHQFIDIIIDQLSKLKRADLNILSIFQAHTLTHY
jgi:hypothetical protein